MCSRPPFRQGSSSYWIRIVAVAFGGGRTRSGGGARCPVELDEAAGLSFVKPALFFVDEKPPCSDWAE